MVLTPLFITIIVLTLLYLWRRGQIDVVKPSIKLPAEVR